MAFVRRCPQCGLDLTDPSATNCPACNAKMVPAPRLGPWIAALIQIAISTIFMWVFKFPKIMMLIFPALIVIATVMSVFLKTRPVSAQVVPQRSVSNPVLFKVLSFAIALCSLAVLCILLFGFVIFMDSWDRWHRYEGQPRHHTEFQVVRAYYQPHAKGGADIYASGMVDGQKEWMGLFPYLHSRPHDQTELDSRVPAGTTIPVYLFPGLKGRSRVQVYTAIPPDEASRRTAMNTLSYGMFGLAVTAGIIFVLSRLRRACFVEEPLLQPVGTGQSSVT